MTPPPPPAPGSPAGLRALLGVFGSAGACVALTYATPSLEYLRPWVPGDPVPVFAALVPHSSPKVTEDVSGAAVFAEPEPDPVAPLPEDPGAGVADPAVARLPAHPPGVPTALVDPDFRGMEPFFRALHTTAQSGGLARASQWGDSTIAADGITGTVRARLQERFGNGGPGYLSAGLDPQWSMRLDVAVVRKGDWETNSLLNGGGGGRYGFGGIVSTAAPDSSVTFYAPKDAEGKRIPMQHAEVYYQTGPERGTWWASAGGRAIGSGSAASEGTIDRFKAVDVESGFTRIAIGAGPEGPATFYGVVMETQGPGVVWDALGVVGVGTHSFGQQGRRHLTAQVAQRKPDLTVVMLGGNELGAPSLKGDGTLYDPYFARTLDRLRAGAPDAGCLVITPLDQGTREGGKPRSKPTLPTLVAAQRRVAADWGCAFWDARAAMGGEDAIVRWGQMKPPLAWTDLLHLSSTGQDIIGQLLADAILAHYDDWVASGGPSRPPAPPPAAPAAVPDEAGAEP